MIKIGIVADNYKLDRFKNELTKKEFTSFKIFPFTENTSTIQVDVDPDKVNEVKKVCEHVELHFKRRN